MIFIKSISSSVSLPLLRSFFASLLRQALRNCFLDEEAATLVIATLSPSTADLEHSMDTLGTSVLGRLFRGVIRLCRGVIRLFRVPT